MSWGGAIVLRGTAGSVTADFISNKAVSTSESAGGALVIAVCKPAAVIGDFIGCNKGCASTHAEVERLRKEISNKNISDQK